MLFERRGTKRAKKILAMESVNSLRISAPQWLPLGLSVKGETGSVKGETKSVKGETKSANFWQGKCKLIANCANFWQGKV